MLYRPLAVKPTSRNTWLLQVGSSHEELVAAAQSLGRKDELMEKRRADRAEHQHKQIWTKDPHGGAYRKVLFRALGSSRSSLPQAIL